MRIFSGLNMKNYRSGKCSHRPVFCYVVLAALFGYLFIHPFVNVAEVIFHHKNADESLSWGGVTAALRVSFTLQHLPHALSFVVLSGLIGYFFGRIITTYRVINEQLERLSLIGKNASMVVHDLNNPLSAIKLAVQFLKKKAPAPNQTKYLDLIDKEASRISYMALDIKMAAAGERALKLVKKPIDLKSFFEEIVAKMQPRHPVTIKSGMRNPAPVDEGYFERLFWNLIKNADYALERVEGGKIEVLISREGNSASIIVRDNGPGIPRDILRHIFDFASSAGKGTKSGIGLYNCREIAEAHGGKLEIKSKVGLGTSCRIEIPLDEEHKNRHR